MWALDRVADPDPSLLNYANLRPLVCRQTLHGSIVSVYGPLGLNFELLKVLNYDLNGDRIQLFNLLRIQIHADPARQP